MSLNYEIYGMQARGILLKRIHKCIKERREHPEVLRNDLLTKLVREGTFSDEIIADTIIFFVFAGVETSAMAMTFAVKYLTENPRALEELREYFIVELQCWRKSRELWNGGFMRQDRLKQGGNSVYSHY
ncbi:hypothetical protein KI387_011061 [Taxus chinensis]|uniref:Cytochrome P450 n=1 Tax=Taxus chinensis TaxID=29808 RepID=A0AA38FM21_TAXCH|nr:hypothetical protein KI387_011061 [Taxus chinensis]